MEIKLLFAADNPPLSVISAAKIAGISLSFDSSLSSGSFPQFVFSNGSTLQGTFVLLRYIGRVASDSKLYEKDTFLAGQVDEWLEYLSILDKGSEFESGCSYLDTYLSTHTALVGYDVTIADIHLWAALTATGQRWESLRKSNKKYQNLVRWYNSLSSEYSSSLIEVGQMVATKKGSAKPATVKSKDQNSGADSKLAVGNGNDKVKTSSRPEVDLPDAEVGKVCLRFAPEPSGYLHIGHSKAALLNKYFAEKYEGKLIIRFDDTNPAKESSEFVDNLLKDIETLDIAYEKVTYTSDYFPELMKKVEELIEQGKAYVDDTPREQMQKERMDGIESKCRNESVETNLKLWKEY